MTRLLVVLACVLLLAGCSGRADTPPPSSSATSGSRTNSPSGSRTTSSADASGLPSQTTWLADVRTAMRGSRAYLDAQLAKPGASRQKPAINLDIDNTALASEYDFGAPVPDVLQLARYAHRRGVAVLFNTARADDSGASQLATQQLEKAGYPVDEVCLRAPADGVPEGKQACRRHFVAEGYTILANIGNNDTDFAGGDYQRAFRLPNYGQLS